MSRKSSISKTSDSINTNDHSCQWLMITQESNFLQHPNEDCRPTCCRLRHPKTGIPAVYMFTDGGRQINEIMAFNEGHRSWFIGNYVQSDGTMLVTTPVDPLFIALPYLIKASQSGKYTPLDCLLEDGDFPECKRLENCISSDELGNVATVKGSDGLFAFKYDSDKTLAWLKMKVDSLVLALERHKLKVSGSASVSTYVKSVKSSTSVSQDDYIRYACGLIGEYLQPDLAKQLGEHLGVKNASINDVNDNHKDQSPVKKKAKVDSITPLEDYSANGILAGAQKYSSDAFNTSISWSDFWASVFIKRQPEKLTLAQKKLSKVDKTGMKSLSSFFSAKSTKK